MLKFKENFRLFVPITADENGKLPTEIQVMPFGAWDSPTHGQFSVTESDADEMIANFEEGTRAGDSLPIDLGHDGGAAAGWMTKLFKKMGQENPNHDGIWANVDWTSLGKDNLANKIYKFFSPEWAPVYQDGQTGDLISNVLIGGGLVNRPFFKDMQTVVAHEFKKPHTEGETSTSDYILFIEGNKTAMNLQALLAKNPADLTAEEKAFIKEHREELTPEQLKAHDLEEAPQETDEQKAEREAAEAKAKEDADAAAAKEAADKEAADKAEAEEKAAAEAKKAAEAGQTVTMTAGEKAALEEKANQGAEALRQLTTVKASEKIGGWLFSDKGGRFPVKLKDGLTSFYLSLSEAQQTAFEAIVKEMPDSKLFQEIGSGDDKGGDGELSPAALISKEATRLFEEEKAKGGKRTYSDFVKQVSDSHPEWAKAYEEARKEGSTQAAE